MGYRFEKRFSSLEGHSPVAEETFLGFLVEAFPLLRDFHLSDSSVDAAVGPLFASWDGSTI